LAGLASISLARRIRAGLSAYRRARFHGGFFAIRREFLLRFAKQAAGFKIVFETIVRGRKTLRVREVPIVFRDRARGMSKMSFAQAMRFALAWLRAIGGG